MVSSPLQTHRAAVFRKGLLKQAFSYIVVGMACAALKGIQEYLSNFLMHIRFDPAILLPEHQLTDKCVHV